MNIFNLKSYILSTSSTCDILWKQFCKLMEIIKNSQIISHIVSIEKFLSFMMSRNLGLRWDVVRVPRIRVRSVGVFSQWNGEIPLELDQNSGSREKLPNRPRFLDPEKKLLLWIQSFRVLTFSQITKKSWFHWNASYARPAFQKKKPLLLRKSARWWFFLQQRGTVDKPKTIKLLKHWYFHKSIPVALANNNRIKLLFDSRLTK